MPERIPAFNDYAVRFNPLPDVVALRVRMAFDLQCDRFNLHVIDNVMETFFARIKITDSQCTHFTGCDGLFHLFPALT